MSAASDQIGSILVNFELTYQSGISLTNDHRISVAVLTQILRDQRFYECWENIEEPTVSDYESGGSMFESCRVHHLPINALGRRSLDALLNFKMMLTG